MIPPGALADALAALSVTVERVRVWSGAARVSSYPGGLRPSAIVEVAGLGRAGFGECVAFSAEAQRAFATSAARRIASGRGAVGRALDAELEPFERAALEAALIDLALKQHGASLAELASAPSARLRWVRSFAASERPHQIMAELRRQDAASEFKVDVAPDWSDAVVDELARAQGLAVLDFKELALPALSAQLARAVPAVIFEDPPPGTAHARVALDRPLLTLSDVERAARAGLALNLKAPRMGGFLSVLRALELAQRHGALTYFGGMFEVGPGREQARQLAVLYCPHGPNDLAPFEGGRSSLIGASPSRVTLDSVGFGATFDWTALGAQLA